DWICIVSDDCSEQRRFAEIERVLGDDPRFRLSRSGHRLGFYRNFERALTSVPAGVRYVALADQDDLWHPGKLARLRQALGRAELRFVDEPLYDYVQHSAAVLGHSGPPPHNRKHRLPTRAGLRERRPSWREAYVSQWCRLRETARVLIRRCNGELTPRKR